MSNFSNPLKKIGIPKYSSVCYIGMSVFNANEVCCLFCCPPWPSKIVAKLAFLPPRPTYIFQGDSSNSYTLIPNEDSNHELVCGLDEDKIDCFYTRTKKNNLVACMFLKCVPRPKYTILYSHGNAVDLGQMCGFYVALGSRVNCDVFSYDYSGYGMSTGKPSEKNLYADIEAALLALRARYGIRPENVILYGQSIGTAPTVHLASKYDVGGVVLHSPLMSGVRVAFPNTRRTWFFDAFTNIEKISRVTAPVLVIHGTDDEIIDFNHGRLIYEKCRTPVEPLWVEGAGHNDIEQHNVYLERLKKFLNKDLASFGRNRY